MLRKELDERLATVGLLLEWGDIVRDLDCVEEITVEQDAKCFVLRSEATACAAGVFRAVGVALRHLCASSRSPPRRLPKSAAAARDLVPRARKFP